MINLVEYFDLARSTFLSVGGNFKPFSLADQRQIAPIIAALSRESVVVRTALRLSEDYIALTVDAKGQPVNLIYSPQLGTIAFGVAGQSYLTSAPPAFKDLWMPLICARSP